ncbi:hypothetical protein SNE40_019987 [Patella caerulea]|uniref:Uncharacterized protein n=1 Tax=Patella caerulea TaxID=87958 RepID=A0AAN8G6N1_PATCE
MSNKQPPKRVHVSSSSGDEIFDADLAQINSSLISIQEQLKCMVIIDSLDETLKSFFKKVRTEIRNDIKAEMSQELDQIKTSLAEEKTKVQTLIVERDNLKSEMLQVISNQEQLELDVKESIKLGNRNEQYSRKKNIKILGLKENEGEDLKQEIKRLAHELADIQLGDTQIVAIHRLPSKYRDRPRPIILKLL